MNRFYGVLPKLLLFFIAVASYPSAGIGGIIYSQTTPEEPSAAFGSEDRTGFQKIADNFLIEGTDIQTVQSVRFIGGYGLNNPPPLDPSEDSLPNDDFRIIFFEDASGVPGNVIAGGDFHAGKPAFRSPTNEQLLNGTRRPYEFAINLEESIALAPNTQYWISITNVPGIDHGWLWSRADGGFDQYIVDTLGDLEVGSWEVFETGGMWFELNSERIPEPSAFALLVVGIALSHLPAVRDRQRYTANS